MNVLYLNHKLKTENILYEAMMMFRDHDLATQIKVFHLNMLRLKMSEKHSSP